MDKNLIDSVIEEYNKYHSPEASVKLVKLNKKSIIVKFSGPFCKSCGVYDWFDDFRIELERKGLKFKIKKYRQKNESFLVEFHKVI